MYKLTTTEKLEKTVWSARFQNQEETGYIYYFESYEEYLKATIEASCRHSGTSSEVMFEHVHTKQALNKEKLVNSKSLNFGQNDLDTQN